MKVTCVLFPPLRRVYNEMLCARTFAKCLSAHAVSRCTMVRAVATGITLPRVRAGRNSNEVVVEDRAQLTARPTTRSSAIFEDADYYFMISSPSTSYDMPLLDRLLFFLRECAGTAPSTITAPALIDAVAIRPLIAEVESRECVLFVKEAQDALALVLIMLDWGIVSSASARAAVEALLRRAVTYYNPNEMSALLRVMPRVCGRGPALQLSRHAALALAERMAAWCARDAAAWHPASMNAALESFEALELGGRTEVDAERDPAVHAVARLAASEAVRRTRERREVLRAARAAFSGQQVALEAERRQARGLGDHQVVQSLGNSVSESVAVGGTAGPPSLGGVDGSESVAVGGTAGTPSLGGVDARALLNRGGGEQITAEAVARVQERAAVAVLRVVDRAVHATVRSSTPAVACDSMLDLAASVHAAPQVHRGPSTASVREAEESAGGGATIAALASEVAWPVSSTALARAAVGSLPDAQRASDLPPRASRLARIASSCAALTARRDGVATWWCQPREGPAPRLQLAPMAAEAEYDRPLASPAHPLWSLVAESATDAAAALLSSSSSMARTAPTISLDSVARITWALATIGARRSVDDTSQRRGNREADASLSRHPLSIASTQRIFGVLVEAAQMLLDAELTATRAARSPSRAPRYNSSIALDNEQLVRLLWALAASGHWTASPRLVGLLLNEASARVAVAAPPSARSDDTDAPSNVLTQTPPPRRVIPFPLASVSGAQGNGLTNDDEGLCWESSLTARQVCRVAWAAATIGQGAPRDARSAFFAAMSAELPRRWREATTSNATAFSPNRAGDGAAHARPLRHEDALDANDVAQLVWAVARARVSARGIAGFLTALGDGIVDATRAHWAYSSARQRPSSDSRNSITSPATATPPPPQLAGLAITRSQWRVENVSHVVWGYATAGVIHNGLLDAIAHTVGSAWWIESNDASSQRDVRHADGHTSQTQRSNPIHAAALAQLLHGFALTPGALSTHSAYVSRLTARLNRVQPDALREAFAGPALTPSRVALHTFALATKRHNALVLSNARHKASTTDRGTADHVDVREMDQLITALPRALEDIVHAAARSVAASSASSAAHATLHRGRPSSAATFGSFVVAARAAVTRIAARAGWPQPQWEFVTSKALAVDGVIVDESRGDGGDILRIAFEFDGPSHYVPGAGLALAASHAPEHAVGPHNARRPRLNFASRLKGELLVHHGWSVVRISYLDWLAVDAAAGGGVSGSSTVGAAANDARAATVADGIIAAAIRGAGVALR